MSQLNIELKARCESPDFIRAFLVANDARFVGTDYQKDTYFNVPNGRMKLRQGNIENALIHYVRAEQSGSNSVSMFPVVNGDELADLLGKAIGCKAVVEKKREIYFIGNVKFYLDEVLGLGFFVEIEAIDIDGSIGEEQLELQCARYKQALQISDAAVLTRPYCDMMPM